MRTRPIGVTILAVLFAVNVATYAALAVLALFSRETLAAVLHALSPSGAGPEAMHTAMGQLRPLYYTAMAVLTGAMAVGFWRLRNWARIVMLAMIVFSLLLMLAEIRPLLAAPTAGAIGLTLVRIGLSVFGVWYLLRRSVRDAFRRPPAAAMLA